VIIQQAVILTPHNELSRANEDKISHAGHPNSAQAIELISIELEIPEDRRSKNCRILPDFLVPLLRDCYQFQAVQTGRTSSHIVPTFNDARIFNPSTIPIETFDVAEPGHQLPIFAEQATRRGVSNQDSVPTSNRINGYVNSTRFLDLGDAPCRQNSEAYTSRIIGKLRPDHRENPHKTQREQILCAISHLLVS
jgi:hypothetical protein